MGTETITSKQVTAARKAMQQVRKSYAATAPTRIQAEATFYALAEAYFAQAGA